MVGFVPEDDTNHTISDFTSQISGKLRSLIAAGSFGEVYRYTIESREVAVKVFKIDMGKDMGQNKKGIRRELNVWLQLKHQNIVPLLGIAYIDPPFPALVSQWMSSGTLYAYLEQQAIITTSARVRLGKGIADGLHYLHSNNVVHGDLHPANVLIDGLGNPCLTDFGLATVVEDPELQWSTITLGLSFDSRWRAPEVLGIKNDPQRPTSMSDIYSFGGVVFFIVSGNVPWKEKKLPHQICVELSTGATPVRPHHISDDHWNLIQKCWSWDPRNRPGAWEVLNEISGGGRSRNVVVYGKTGAGKSSVINPTAGEAKARAPPGTERRTMHREEHSIVSGGGRPRNVVVYGQTGAGKSSVINLMAGEVKAEVSRDMVRCTMHWEEHLIAFDGYNYQVFDTIGLEEHQCGIEEYLDAIVNARSLITKLDKEGGIDLLLFCVRAGRITPTTQNNYRLFYEWLCEKKVPIVLVVTGLESEHNMEDWWTRNKDRFDKYNIVVNGHACIIAANKLTGRHQQLYQESRQLVRKLVREHTYDRPEVVWKGVDGWFRRFIRELLPGKHNLKKDTVTTLIERCGMPQEAAVLLASHIREELRHK